MNTRVRAKKTTVRAPFTNVEALYNSVEAAIIKQEQKMGRVSPGSASLSTSKSSNLAEVEPKKTRARGGPRKIKKDAKPAVKKENKSPESETPKNKGGRPQRSRTPLTSPSGRSSPNRQPRVFKPFLGGQRLAAIAKETFINNAAAQAIVIEKAVFEAGKERRRRVAWSAAEIEALQNGVRIYGESAWSAIINDPKLKFYPHRTQVDLKDKWRNLTAYKAYHEHPIRRFVLVNTRHEEILSQSGNPHVLNNRWPRDAALKMSTKDWIYPVNESGIRADSALIHLKEVMDSEGKSWRPQVVHVYRVTRALQRPKNIKKFSDYQAVWTGKVDKIAEEMLIKLDEVLSVEEQQNRNGARFSENPENYVAANYPESPRRHE